MDEGFEDDGLAQGLLDEGQELTALISAVVQSEGTAAGQVYERYRQIVCKYQEQPQLLDGWLEGIVQPLAGLLRKQAVAAAPAAAAHGPSSNEQRPCTTRTMQGVCSLLHVLISVRGYKTIVKFFPHEAADLERVLHVLLLVRDESAAMGSSAGVEAADGTGGPNSVLSAWEAQSVLLLWLSILILTPFNLETLDSSCGVDGTPQQPPWTAAPRAISAVGGVSTATPAAAAAPGPFGGQPRPYPPLAARILDTCTAYLDHPGAVREAAALVLARLLARPDMAAALEDYLRWQAIVLEGLAAGEGERAGPGAVFLVPGVLQSLALLFALGQRERLLPHAPCVWRQLSALLDEATPAHKALLASNALARKLATKLVQRLGMTLLAPRLARWRYVRGDMQTLGGALLQAQQQQQHAKGMADAGAGAMQSSYHQQQQDEQQQEGEDKDGEGGAAEFEVPEEVEEVLGALLASLRDRDTIVRWSGAKGVGRLTGCLPKELGDDVVGSVVELMAPTESDTAWHGACLALAELARRSLLLPERLPAVTPLVCAALAYDVRRGPHSVGAHVRDAAAYVCWAFARAYAPPLLADAFQAIAPALLVLACYDREVHCRRAGSSAFQEAVGRLGEGVVEGGIDVLGAADYFSVGNIHTAYLRVSPYVARYPRYRTALAGHLLAAKLRHWDKLVRALAACGLAALVPTDAAWFAREPLRVLLPRATDDVLDVRLGAVLGAAELLPALAAAGAMPGGDDAGGAAGLLPVLEGARLYRGRGGELMREAAARYLQCASDAQAAGGRGLREGSGAGAWALPLADAHHAAAQALLDDCLRHVLEGVRCAGVAALAAYARAHAWDPPVRAALQRSAAAWLVRLRDPAPPLRRGAAAALGALPAGLVGGRGAEVLSALCAASVPEQDPEARDVEARVAAVRALGRLACELWGGGVLVSKGVDGDAGSPLSHTHPQDGGLGGGARAAAGALRAATVDGGTSPPSVPPTGLLVSVCGALLQSLDDYTTDNRGDVGSWVREAGMEALADATLLLAAFHPATAPAQEQPRQEGPARRAGAVAADASRQEAASSGGSSWASPTEVQQVVTAAVAGLLRQALERIARVRETALRQLRRLLAEGSPTSALAPHAAAVRLALPEYSAIAAGVASLDAFSMLGRLLALPGPYQPALLEGLVAGIGGVDAQLARAAGAVLLEVLAAGGQQQQEQPQQQEQRQQDQQVESSAAATPAAAAPAAGSGLKAHVGQLLLELWAREACALRLSTPLIRTALLLLTKGAFSLVRVPAAARPTATGDAGSSISAQDEQQEQHEHQEQQEREQQQQQQQSAAAVTCNGAPGDQDSPSRTGAGTQWFACRALTQLKGELRGCGNVARLLDGAELAAALVGVAAVREPALQQALVLLVNRFPKVRRHSAEQLYLQLLALQVELEDEEDDGEQGGPRAAAGTTNGAEGVCSNGQGQQHSGPDQGQLHMSADALEAALDLLLLSAWDGPLQGAKAARDELAAGLGITMRSRIVSRERDPLAQVKPARVGGSESYQSLLDDAARGGGY